MALNHHFSNGNPLHSRSQARPTFDWPKLRKAIEPYKRLGLRYFPAWWGDKNPAIPGWKPYQNKAPTLEEGKTLEDILGQPLQSLAHKSVQKQLAKEGRERIFANQVFCEGGIQSNYGWTYKEELRPKRKERG